ncbi:hypothetical protein MRX96_006442 [Rhipicephalus microplus]
MEEPTPSPVTTTTTMAPPTTRDYSGLYISPPIMVLDGNGERDNTRVVHDVLVVKNRPSRRPSTLRPPGSSNLVQPSIIRRPPPFWAGTAVPSGYGVSHAVLMNNHRPPSASSAFKRPFPGVTSIHIYPPDHSAVDDNVGVPAAGNNRFGATLRHQHQHRPVVTTTAPSSSLVAPIGSMPGILGPIGNLMQKFPTGSLSMFQNIGRIMAVLPTMLAAFLLTALLFV